MSSPQSLIVNYLDAARIMHVATSDDQGVWCAAVYFAVDNQHAIYWLSDPKARHSRSIPEGQSVTIAGAFTLPQQYGQPQQGLQVEGEATLIKLEEIEGLYESYAERFTAHGLVDDILAGRDKRRLYQLKPARFVLLDEKFMPDELRYEWRLDGSSPVDIDETGGLEQASLPIDEDEQPPEEPPSAPPDAGPQVPPVIAPDRPRSIF